MIAWEMLGGAQRSRPPGDDPVGSAARSDRGQPAALAVSWFGHSTALVEIDGYRVLTDPVWSDRCSPSDTVGPQRLHPPPVPLEALPARRCGGDQPRPLRPPRHRHRPGAGPHAAGAVLRAARSRSPPARVGCPRAPHRRTRLESKRPVDELTVICMPARHFSGRFLSRNTTLWASWAFIGPQPSRIFRRRHRLHQELRRDRRRPWAVRSDAAADRRLQPAVAGHPHESRGSGPGAPGRQRLGLGVCWCRFTGARSGWRRIRGPSPSSGCSTPPSRPGRGGGAHARSSASIRRARRIQPVVAALKST